ncbi:aquaporin AQPAe.a-like [Belonocnema kinseyi]|uniref:aquaporin AQPAe.a-like n=1 Tax=Belonocnema kinseyi TaxID=2817044 RepID=UPI00143E0382|nr:aquaporin AQPAe.a-like [Belonocnema kinseyi]
MTSERSVSIWRADRGTITMCIAEILGTAILMFLGCMGGIGTLSATPPPPMQSGLTFGMTVNLIIMMLGHVSGAHLNPAVTIGAVIWGLKSIPTGLLYVVAQFIGATIGYGMLMIVTPYILLDDGMPNSTAPLCVTVIHTGISLTQAILIETICTAIILLAACGTWDPRCAHTTDSTALRFGFSVSALSFAAAPYTGCSMNPARSFAPALWQNSWKDQWVYWIGPVFGALLGTLTYKVLFSPRTMVLKKSSMSITKVEDLVKKTCDSIDVL